MREEKRTFKVNTDETENLILKFRVEDGPKILHELDDALWDGHGTVEIELTIRYPDMEK